mmetsp:Transcript_9483/g.23729  ORF Transcript_9483/g.23729 Transcript_9483/m.23729 type:complete len:211 (-) Transcript_9483:39-671(-)
MPALAAFQTKYRNNSRVVETARHIVLHRARGSRGGGVRRSLLQLSVKVEHQAGQGAVRSHLGQDGVELILCLHLIIKHGEQEAVAGMVVLLVRQLGQLVQLLGCLLLDLEEGLEDGKVLLGLHGQSSGFDLGQLDTGTTGSQKVGDLDGVFTLRITLLFHPACDANHVLVFEEVGGLQVALGRVHFIGDVAHEGVTHVCVEIHGWLSELE